MHMIERETARRTERADKRQAAQIPYARDLRLKQKQRKEPVLGFWGFVKSILTGSSSSTQRGGPSPEEQEENEVDEDLVESRSTTTNSGLVSAPLPTLVNGNSRRLEGEHAKVALTLSERGREMLKDIYALDGGAGPSTPHKSALRPLSSSTAIKKRALPEEPTPYEPPVPPSNRRLKFPPSTPKPLMNGEQSTLANAEFGTPAQSQERVARFLLERNGAPLNEYEIMGIQKALTGQSQMPTAALFDPSNLSPSPSSKHPSPSPSVLQTSVTGNTPFSSSLSLAPRHTPKKYLSANPNPVRYNGLGSSTPRTGPSRDRPRTQAFTSTQTGLSSSLRTSVSGVTGSKSAGSLPDIANKNESVNGAGKKRRIDEDLSLPLQRDKEQERKQDSGRPLPGKGVSTSLSAPSMNALSPAATFSPSQSTSVGVGLAPPKDIPFDPHGHNARGKSKSAIGQPLARPSPLRQAMTPGSPPTPPSGKSNTYMQMKELIDRETAAIEPPPVLNPYEKDSPVKPAPRKAAPRKSRVAKPTSTPTKKKTDPVPLSPVEQLEKMAPKPSSPKKPRTEQSKDQDKLTSPFTPPTSSVQKPSSSSPKKNKRLSPEVEVIEVEEDMDPVPKRRKVNGVAQESADDSIIIEDLQENDNTTIPSKTVKTSVVTEPSPAPPQTQTSTNKRSTLPLNRFSTSPTNPSPLRNVETIEDTEMDSSKSIGPSQDPKEVAKEVNESKLPHFSFASSSTASTSSLYVNERAKARSIEVEKLPTFDFNARLPAPPAAVPFNWGAVNATMKTPQAASGEWTCNTCFLKNPASAFDKCTICDASRPSAAPAPTIQTTSAAPAPTTQTTSGFNWAAANPAFKASVKSAEGEWTCGTCGLKNPATATAKCTICDADR